MKKLFPVIAGLAVLLLALPVQANTIISTINGFYDVDAYDTPSLSISNTSGFAFTNVVLKVTGYQEFNNGVSQSMSLPDIGAGTNMSVIWGSGCGYATGPCFTANQVVATVGGGLFAYDYDDSHGTGVCNVNHDPSLPSNLCGNPGNFYVTFTATWNGQSIYSQFSPDPNLSGAGNAAGVFVGWEGLDPYGWSETFYDSHNAGGPQGVLANIYEGTPPPVSGVPEPSSLVLLGSGLVGIGSRAWKRFLG